MAIDEKTILFKKFLSSEICGEGGVASSFNYADDIYLFGSDDI